MCLSPLWWSALGVRRPLADAEDHELRGPQRRDADQADEPPVVEVVLGHRRAVAADEVRLLRLISQQRAVLPLVEQEVVDGAPDGGPETLTVRLEHGPLRAAVDRVLEEREVTSQVDVLPLRVGAHRPGAPQPVTPTFEEPEAVDPLGVE